MHEVISVGTINKMNIECECCAAAAAECSETKVHTHTHHFHFHSNVLGRCRYRRTMHILHLNDTGLSS